jgi:hypothetical protein
MTAPQALTGQHIGQAEKATRAVLDRLLAETGTEFVEWVIVNVLATNQSSMDRDDLLGRVVNGLKIPAEALRTAIDALANRGILATKDDQLALTSDGEALYRRLRTGIDQITQLLYGDIPASDLQTAQHVLATVTERANAELAS